MRALSGLVKREHGRYIEQQFPGEKDLRIWVTIMIDALTRSFFFLFRIPSSIVPGDRLSISNVGKAVVQSGLSHYLLAQRR
jgi:hypothetical protein